MLELFRRWGLHERNARANECNTRKHTLLIASQLRRVTTVYHYTSLLKIPCLSLNRKIQKDSSVLIEVVPPAKNVIRPMMDPRYSRLFARATLNDVSRLVSDELIRRNRGRNCI